MNRFDVNGDGRTSALDALVVINQLDDLDDQGTLPFARPAGLVTRWYDVNGDGRGSALDALGVINQLARQNRTANQSQPSGEMMTPSNAPISPLPSSVADAPLALRRIRDVGDDELESQLTRTDGFLDSTNRQQTFGVSFSRGEISRPVSTDVHFSSGQQEGEADETSIGDPWIRDLSLLQYLDSL